MENSLPMSDGGAERTAAFVKAVCELKLKPGEVETFGCPVCGHTAIAKAALQNGHIHAACIGCGAVMME